MTFFGHTPGCGFQPVALPAGMPPTSNDIIAGLNEHLIRVLSELRAKERVVVESQGALERVQRKLAVIIHQQVRNTWLLGLIGSRVGRRKGW